MISVIITTRNYQRYVERAIRSVLDQSMPKDQYEVVVVNDASTDHTRSVLENYEHDVRVIHLETNVGLAAARNRGIEKAKGQFVVFVDADDYVQKNLLLVASMYLHMNRQIDAVAVDYLLVDERGGVLERVSAKEKPIACGIMFRKDLLYDVGLYDEAFRAREEEDLRIRFLKRYAIYNIELPLYRYRQHGNNLTKNHAEMRRHAVMLADKHARV